MIRTNVNDSKRWFLKLTAFFSVALVSNITSKNTDSSIYVDNDIVILNGWVLLKSDLN
jgi:hypothetical protein